MAADTARGTGPAELVTQDPVGVATFVSERDGDVPSVVVRDGDKEAFPARGARIVVIQTLQGPEVRAMLVPAELRGRCDRAPMPNAALQPSGPPGRVAATLGTVARGVRRSLTTRR